MAEIKKLGAKNGPASKPKTQSVSFEPNPHPAPLLNSLNVAGESGDSLRLRQQTSVARGSSWADTDPRVLLA